MRGLMHYSGSRKGYVLLTVTLVGALLFISALMFISQLTTESHVAKTDAYFKSALNVAETGLGNTLMDIRSGVDAPTWAQRFEAGGVSFAAVASPAVHGTYEVAVDVVGTPLEIAPNQYRAEVQIRSIGAIYTPAVAVMEGSSDYAARRAVLSRTIATWTYVPARTETTPETVIPPVYQPTTFDIKYGVFTGANLVIKGSSQEIDGDVFANGNVYIQKASGLVNGDAYAAGTVTGGIPAGDKFPGQTPIPFPEIDITIMRQLFDAYLRGLYPYNGTVAGLTNTSYTPAGLINRAIYNVDDLVAAAQIDTATGLYELPSMMPISGTVLGALIDPTAVYYFDGDVKLASGSSLSGTIAINGTFFIAGSVQVGTGGTLANIIVTGDIIKSTGCSEINGLVYTGGSFTGRGTSDINGALISRKSVDMSGNFNVTYDGRLSPITIGGTLVQEEQVIPGETTSYPAVYNLDAFTQPASGERMWREVTDIT